MPDLADRVFSGAYHVDRGKAGAIDEPGSRCEWQCTMGLQRVCMSADRTLAPNYQPREYYRCFKTHRCSGRISVWDGWLRPPSSCAPPLFKHVVDQLDEARAGRTLVLRPGGSSSVLSRHDLRGHDMNSGARSPLHL